MTNALKLYEVADELVPLLESGIDEDGVISEELGAALAKFDRKGQSVAAYILNQEATAETIDAHAKKLQEKAKSLRKGAEGLKRYLLENMKRTGTTEIKADDGTFKAKFYAGRDHHVIVEDQWLLPPEFCRRIPQTSEPDKKAIANALVMGVEVPGARLAWTDRIEIKVK